MARKASSIILSNSDVNALSILSSCQDPDLARRAKVILECGKGLSNKEVSAITKMNEADVGRWRKTFLTDGIDGLKGKQRGGNHRPGAPDETFYRRLDELLAQEGRNWTVQELVQELASTVYIVSAALRDRGINLQRQRQWYIPTRDELIPKTVDVVGLYLAKDEQAIIVRCAQEALSECHGEFITRNRELSEDYLHYDGEITLADAINTAVHHVGDTTRMVPVSLTEFLNRTISAFPMKDGYEHHILICSPKNIGYQGPRLKDIYQSWADDPEQWLRLVHSKISELADRSQLHPADELQKALGLYLGKCMETTAPLIWRKKPDQLKAADPQETQDKEKEDHTVPFESGLESSPFLDELRELLHRYLSPGLESSEIVKSGFISFAYDQEEVRVHMEDDNGTLPGAADVDFGSIESCNNGLTAIEKSLINTRNRAGVCAAEMTADLLKKKQVRPG